MNKLITSVVLLTVSASSFAADGDAGNGVDQIFSGVDLTTVLAFIVSIGGLIIGISLAEKGVGISKRNIKKA